jgi:hypothetical protein
VDAHIYTTQTEKNLKRRYLPESWGNCFLEQEMSGDGGIHATRDHINVRSVLRNIKKNCVRPFRLKGVECVVLLHDDARPHASTAARTGALLEHFNWELFDHTPYSPDLAPVSTTSLPPEELAAITALTVGTFL